MVRPCRTRLNLSWLHHLRATPPGIPILVEGDFDVPYSLSGSSKAPKEAHSFMTPFRTWTFPCWTTLLYQPSHQLGLMHRTLQGGLAPGTTPGIQSQMLGQATIPQFRLACIQKTVVETSLPGQNCSLGQRLLWWTRFSLTTENRIFTLQSIPTDCTIHSRVNEDQPKPDMLPLNSGQSAAKQRSMLIATWCNTTLVPWQTVLRHKLELQEAVVTSPVARLVCCPLLWYYKQGLMAPSKAWSVGFNE